ncbi:MAG: UDP-N-acetylmuramate dehydrogenase [Prevotellaceae bacterium]|jgi:UDP-N-acetylmuramate dehydrogenase|nr:UDP-N-acetylmuramate dehydrogenase [Prevotellaceae bacterium]
MVHTDYSLRQLNTFGFDVRARFFAAPETVGELGELLAGKRYAGLPQLILGGGSNTLFCDDFDGLVIHPQIAGIEKTAETGDAVYLRVGAGVVWDDFVAYAVQHHWGGVENLSFIPGHVGASPVQNIGAYGAEAKDCIRQVECILTATGDRKLFAAEECAFGYRDSIFKQAWRGRLIVTHVVFRLAKNPALRTHYGNVAEELEKFPEVTLQTLREAIIAIRRKKLPDPAMLGNAGSFFKNPVVPKKLADGITSKDPLMTAYPVSSDCVKLPAARLIEQAGWKGRRAGAVGVHAQQALVLVHYGGGTGHDILALSTKIRQSVYEKFGINLEPEVNVIEKI